MSSRGTAVILALSLGLNLLVIGALVGFAIRGGPMPRFPAHLGDVLSEVAPEERQALRAEMSKMREDTRPLHRELRRQQRQLAKQMLNEPFDEDATREAFAELRLRHSEVQTRMHEQMITVMKDLNPEQRAKLLRQLVRRGAPHKSP